MCLYIQPEAQHTLRILHNIVPSQLRLSVHPIHEADRQFRNGASHGLRPHHHLCLEREKFAPLKTNLRLRSHINTSISYIPRSRNDIISTIGRQRHLFRDLLADEFRLVRKVRIHDDDEVPRRET